MKNLYLALCLMLASSVASATSVIDFTDASVTTAGTNITDTVTGALTFILPIVIAVVAAKVGVRLFKSFSGSI